MQVRLIIATNQNLNKYIFVAASRKGHLAFGIWHLAYSGVAARRQHFYQMTPGQRKLKCCMQTYLLMALFSIVRELANRLSQNIHSLIFCYRDPISEPLLKILFSFERIIIFADIKLKSPWWLLKIAWFPPCNDGSAQKDTNNLVNS